MSETMKIAIKDPQLNQDAGLEKVVWKTDSCPCSRSPISVLMMLFKGINCKGQNTALESWQELSEWD